MLLNLHNRMHLLKLGLFLCISKICTNTQNNQNCRDQWLPLNCMANRM